LLYLVVANHISSSTAAKTNKQTNLFCATNHSQFQILSIDPTKKLIIMSPSNNNKNTEKTVTEKIQQHREEKDLLERFKKTAVSKLEQMSKQSKETGVKYKISDSEQQVLRKLRGVGVKEGLLAGALTFITLRRGPVYLTRWLQRRQAMQRSGGGVPPPPSQAGSQPGHMPPPPTTSSGSVSSFQLSNPNKATNPFQQAATNSAANNAHQQFPKTKSNLVLGAIWFTLDCTLSLMMFFVVSISYTDVDKLRAELTELPLIEGRSLVSDALCGDIEAELLAIQAEGHPAYQRLRNYRKDGVDTPFGLYLEVITGFVENCQRRRAMEQRLRQESGFSPNEEIAIPPPGVPRDGSRLVTKSRNGVQVEEEDGMLFDDSSSQEFVDDHENWASTFVTDQEEQDKKRP
jgi:hypothetical protein